QTAQHGRLAARVGADDHGHLARTQPQVDVADDDAVVVGEAQSPRLEGVLCRHPQPPRPTRLVVTSRETRNGAPSAPVTTPTGRAVPRTSDVATSWAPSTTTAPTSPAASSELVPCSRRREIGPARKAT